MFSEMTKSFDYGSCVVSKFLKDLQERRVSAMERTFRYLMLISGYLQMNLVVFGFIERYAGRSEHVLLFPCWFPFDLGYLPYHLLAYGWEMIIFQCLGLSIFGVLAFVYLIYSHLTSQITLLNFAIDNSEVRAYEEVRNNNYNTKNNFKFVGDKKSIFKERLKRSYIKGTKQCIKHHSLIIE